VLSQPKRKSRLAWVIPAAIAIIIFVGGVAGNLIAEDLKNFYNAHPKPVWAVFVLALVATIAGVIWDHYRNRDSESPVVKEDNPAPAARDIKITHIHQSQSSTPNPLFQLPPPPSEFTGREKELAELRRGLKDGALICGAQGMGGVGKTALALKLAEELKPRYPDAQFYLDLRGASSEPLPATRAMEHVIRAYHPAAKLPDDPDALSALFHSTLEGKRALLLWDNVKDAAQVAPLRPPATCLMLVTSRRHFAFQGLRSIDLDQMTEEEACELLLKIEPRIGGEAKRIAKLCGYLPLALELAASALKVRKGVPPAEFARRLSDSERRIKLLDKTDSDF
jgi:hypothetical protein